VTERQGRRCRKLLDELKERRGYSHFKEEALDRTMWRACFGRGFGPVVRQTAKLMKELRYIHKRAGVFTVGQTLWDRHCGTDTVGQTLGL
jgi:hypothetical protein